MSMTHEIPQSEWGRFLEAVSRVEHRHSIRIEAARVPEGDQKIVVHVPLVGISYEQKGTDANVIDVTVSREETKGDFTHRVEKPQRLLALEKDDGDLECLDIEDADQGRTLIYFD